jgi:rhodanese-related sulfurtransferase
VLHLDVHGLELLLQSDPDFLLIDVRAPEELTGPLGKIPHSRNVTPQEIEKNPEQFPRDKTLVLICRTGHRSLEAANFLAEHGYLVYSVQGGMQASRELHPLAPPPAEGEPPKKLGGPGHTPDAG